VRSPAGTPVADATVTAARRLLGDGASTGGGGMGRGGMAAKQDTTDENGEFILYGVGPRDLALVAEHETLGRSTTVLVPGSPEPVVIELVLAPFSALDGTVTKAGAPAGGVAINVTSQKVPNTNFIVATGDDGTFRFDRLAPDTYLVQAIDGQGRMGGMGLHTALVTLGAGETKRVALEIPVNEGSIVAIPVTKDGERVSLAQVIVAAAPLAAGTARELQTALAALGEAFTAVGVSFMGMGSKVSNLAAGKYTVCAIPLPRELAMQEVMIYAEREGENLRVFCVPVDVTGQADQEVQVVVEVPAYVPPPAEDKGTGG
jgi:hypothetical protein